MSIASKFPVFPCLRTACGHAGRGLTCCPGVLGAFPVIVFFGSRNIRAGAGKPPWHLFSDRGGTLSPTCPLFLIVDLTGILREINTPRRAVAPAAGKRGRCMTGKWLSFFNLELNFCTAPSVLAVNFGGAAKIIRTVMAEL